MVLPDNIVQPLSLTQVDSVLTPPWMSLFSSLAKPPFWEESTVQPKASSTLLPARKGMGVFLKWSSHLFVSCHLPNIYEGAMFWGFFPPKAVLFFCFLHSQLVSAQYCKHGGLIVAPICHSAWSSGMANLPQSQAVSLLFFYNKPFPPWQALPCLVHSFWNRNWKGGASAPPPPNTPETRGGGYEPPPPTVLLKFALGD